MAVKGYMSFETVKEILAWIQIQVKGSKIGVDKKHNF